jgi:putative immunity protein/bacteriocin
MIKILRKRWQQVVAAILTVIMLGIPAMTGFAAVNMSGLVPGKAAFSTEKPDQYCESCTADPKIVEYAKQMFGLSGEVITGKEEQGYLGLLKSIKEFDNLKEKLSVVRVVKIKPINYVYISGAFKETNDTLLYAVINGNNNEILKLNTVKNNGGERVIVKEYQNDGIIKENSISLAEIARANKQNNQELAAFMEKHDSKITMAAINWEYWCCRYAGALACTMGCMVFFELPPVFALCKFMCGQLWKSGVCGNFK